MYLKFEARHNVNRAGLRDVKMMPIFNRLPCRLQANVMTTESSELRSLALVNILVAASLVTYNSALQSSIPSKESGAAMFGGEYKIA
jgi:hypothetical protein